MSQMKVYAVAKMAATITYYPALNVLTGSVTSSILMSQLEYWFGKTKGKPFYKFLEPCCNNTLYKEGDSWTEELGFGKAEFRSAIKRICKVYKSKREFTESVDKFDGKFYLSYTDKIRGITYYHRNHKLLDEELIKWSKQPNHRSEFTEVKNEIYGSKESEFTEVKNEIYGSKESEFTEVKNEIYGSKESESPYTEDYLQKTTSEDYLQKTSSSSKMAEAVINNKDVIQFFEDNFYLLKRFDLEVISSWCESYDNAIIIEAMKAAKMKNVRNLTYIERVLIDWEQEGICTPEAVKMYLSSKEKRRRDGSSQPSTFKHQCGTTSTPNEDDVTRALRKAGENTKFEDDEEYDY